MSIMTIVLLILAVLALLCCILAAINKCPVWVPVLLLCIYCLLQQIFQATKGGA